MLRGVAVVLLALVELSAQPTAETPQQKTNLPEAALVEAQSLIDAGNLKDAELAAREFLHRRADSADGHYLLGYILFREGNPLPSLTEYTEAARYRPPTALDLEVVGSDYMLLEDYQSASKWLAKAVEADPTGALARFYLGRAEFNQKHFDQAARAFTECLKLDPKNVKAADNLGLTYEALGKTEEAIAAYRAAIRFQTGAPTPAASPYLNLGSLLVENLRADEALQYLVPAAQMLPSDSRAHRELGKTYLLLNRFDEAQIELRKAEELSPENPLTHYLLAQVYRKQGLAARAETETEQYTALTGTHSSPETPLQQARSLLGLGELRDAERVTRSFVDTHRNSAEGHYLLGYILFKEKDPKASLAEYTEGARYRKPSAADLEAVAGDYVLLKDYADADKWFTKAVEWNPNDALGWYYLGRTKYNENRFEEAITAFQKCLLLDPKNVKAEDNLGLSYEGLNRFDEAIAAYRTAIGWQADSSAKDPGPLRDLGSLMVDNDHTEDGLPYLLAAAKISAQDYQVHKQLGKAYMHLNQLDRSRAELEKAVELAPDSAPTHFMLAQVYRRQGLKEKADAEITRYRALTSGDAAVEK